VRLSSKQLVLANQNPLVVSIVLGLIVSQQLKVDLL
jgi:hypothetical protein